MSREIIEGMPVTMNKSIIRSPNSTPGDNFGHSIACNSTGATVAIGVPTAQTLHGEVYVYGKDNSPVQFIRSPKPSDHNHFGHDLSMTADGSRLVVSAIKHGSHGINQAGEVYVYRNLYGTWTLEGTLSVDIKDYGSYDHKGDWFGYSVSIDAGGERIIVGTYKTSQTGVVYIYVRKGLEWHLESKIQLSSFEPGYTGCSVDICGNGDRAVVGTSTTISILKREGTRWVLDVCLKDMNSDSRGFHRCDVAINGTGDLVVVGSDASKSVFVYKRTSIGIWLKEATLTPDYPENAGKFGWSVSVNSIGNKIVVGAPTSSDIDIINHGALHVFKDNDGIGNWSEYSRLLASDGTDNERLGRVVLISRGGNAIFAGNYDPGSDHETNNNKVYRF